MTLIHWLLILGCLPPATWILHDLWAHWTEPGLWRDPEFDEQGNRL